MNSEIPSAKQNHAADRIKQLFQASEDSGGCTEWIPFFCVETRIDFNDVRTGFKETVGQCKALEIYSDQADLLWTDDMVREVDLGKTSSEAPEGVRLGRLPAYVDAIFLARMENQFIQYLLRSYEAKIYRNFDLNVYSYSGESRADFCRRCLELFDGSRRDELDRLHEIFNRRLEQVKQKYLGSGESNELENAKAESRNRVIFSRFSEQMTDLFNSAEYKLKPMPVPPRQNVAMLELEERLMALEWEAHMALSKLFDSFNEKASAVDEYILHPNLKDIHFVRSCILWMPGGKG